MISWDEITQISQNILEFVNIEFVHLVKADNHVGFCDLFILWSSHLKEGSRPEAEFLDEIQTKVLRVFLLAIHSHLYSFALRFMFLRTHPTSYRFYSSFTIHCKGERRKT